MNLLHGIGFLEDLATHEGTSGGYLGHILMCRFLLDIVTFFSLLVEDSD